MSQPPIRNAIALCPRYFIMVSLSFSSREFHTIRAQPIGTARSTRQTDWQTDGHQSSLYNVDLHLLSLLGLYYVVQAFSIRTTIAVVKQLIWYFVFYTSSGMYLECIWVDTRPIPVFSVAYANYYRPRARYIVPHTKPSLSLNWKGVVRVMIVTSLYNFGPIPNFRTGETRNFKFGIHIDDRKYHTNDGKWVLNSWLFCKT